MRDRFKEWYTPEEVDIDVVNRLSVDYFALHGISPTHVYMSSDVLSTLLKSVAHRYTQVPLPAVGFQIQSIMTDVGNLEVYMPEKKLKNFLMVGSQYNLNIFMDNVPMEFLIDKEVQLIIDNAFEKEVLND